MKKTLLLEEERGNMWKKTMEKANSALRFELRFLDNNERQGIHKIEVRNINFQDLMRHLQRGESVLITPELLENSSTNMKKKNRGPWYFVHT
jgi:hypothetical protein